MESPLVCIIILNWNGWRDTLACLHSLHNITYPNYRIILIDNCSTDTSLDEFASRLDSRITFFPLKENLGFAKGCNFGMKYALDSVNPQYILLLNNDTEVEPDFLDKMVEAAETSGAGMVQALMLKQWDHNIIDSTGHIILWGQIEDRGNKEINTGQYTDNRNLIGVSGAVAFYRSEMIRQIGMFDESFDSGYEDSEFSWRAYKNGWKTAYAPTAIIYHKRNASVIKRVRDPVFFQSTWRNSVRPCKMHGTRMQKIQMTINILCSIVKSEVGKWIGKNNVGASPYIIALREMLKCDIEQ
jgi:GT2 family glycosyltransferase